LEGRGGRTLCKTAVEGTKKAAPDAEAACPVLLPLLDELRTYCYENKIEEIPAFLSA
jgi:hypothetical protein